MIDLNTPKKQLIEMIDALEQNINSMQQTNTALVKKLKAYEAAEPVSLYQCVDCDGVYSSIVTLCDCAVSGAFNYRTLHAFPQAAEPVSVEIFKQCVDMLDRIYEDSGLMPSDFIVKTVFETAGVKYHD